MKHTPGKWAVIGTSGYLNQISIGIQHENHIDPIAVAFGIGVQAKANAHLIAAAPEMLALLQRFIDHANNEVFSYPPGALCELRRLIAKTTGD